MENVETEQTNMFIDRFEYVHQSADLYGDHHVPPKVRSVFFAVQRNTHPHRINESHTQNHLTLFIFIRTVPHAILLYVENYPQYLEKNNVPPRMQPRHV